MKTWNVGHTINAALLTVCLLGLGATAAGWLLSTQVSRYAEQALHDFWETADGVMEMAIHVENEMLLISDLLHEGAGQPDLRAKLDSLNHQINVDIERIRNARGVLDTTLEAKLERGYTAYRESREDLIAAFMEFDAARDSFQVHSNRFYNLVTNMEEFGDFNLESAVDALADDEELIDKWVAADGTMHMLIGLLRQYYFINRFLAGETDREILSSIRQGMAFQEYAASRALDSGVFDVFSLGDFEEKDLAAAYRQNYATHVQLLDLVITRYDILEQREADYRERSQELLGLLANTEAVADGAVENNRRPIAQLSLTAQSLFPAVCLLLIVSSILFWRRLTSRVSRPVHSLTESIRLMGKYGQEPPPAKDGDDKEPLAESIDALRSIHRDHIETLEACRREKDDHATLMRNHPDMILVTDKDMRIRYTTPTFERMLGYLHHEWREMHLDQLVSPKSMRVLEEVKTAAIACMSMPIPSRNGMPAQLEVVACDGRHVFVESTAAAMCDDAGVFTGLIMALRDMSEMRDEREERNLLHAAMNQTEEGILICEGMSRALYANPSFEMLMGVGKDEFMRRLDSPGRFGQDDIFALLLPVIQSGEPAAGLAHISVHDERRTLHYEITPVSDVVSQEPISLIVVWDVTKATRIEQELRQAQKMQAIGTLAGGIAHDFNNLLVPILMNAEMLSFSECRNEQDSGRLREIVSAATRARELVRQILTFTRGAAPTLTPMRMDKIVEEAASLCRGSLPADIHTEVSLRSERRVMANRTQLVQVFLNLCANAKEAMPNGGVMRVTVQDFDIEENGEPRRFVKVSFVDTGVGIESDKLERIFEPFFTTRPPGKGTGLGLSIVHGIIEAHGGRIQVESRPNRGTNIQLLFPVVDEAEETIVSHGEFENLRGRLSGEVLVVDDEPANASAIQSLLELMGLNVSTSPDGKTAQHLVTREPDRFRVVITDIGMSEMDGHELAQRLRAIRPDLPLVFISGRQDRLDSAMAAFENAASLMKPFDIDELAQTMHTFFPE